MKKLILISALLLCSLVQTDSMADEKTNPYLNLYENVLTERKQQEESILEPYTGPRCPGSYSVFTWHNCVGHRVWSDGKEYIGEFKNGRGHGQGTLDDAGRQYIGEIKEGKSQGQGTLSWVEAMYVGEVNDQKRHGLGTTSYPDGRKRVGEWKDDKMHGQGTVTYPDGRKRVGEWKDDKMHGQGTVTYAGGRKYVGEWKDDKMQGQGTITYAGGTKYVGEWSYDKMHGQGTITYADGTKYVGKWSFNKMHGQGTITYAGGRKYVGEWKGDKMHGQGTFTLANGDQYIGEYKDGKTHGIGNFYRMDGSMMGGIWANDEFTDGYSGESCSGDATLWSDCIGTLTLDDGTVYVGEFKKGKLQGRGTMASTKSRVLFSIDEAMSPDEFLLYLKGYSTTEPIAQANVPIAQTNEPIAQTNEPIAQSKTRDFLSELEEAMPLKDAGMNVVYAEQCAANYWMEEADSQAFVEAISGMIDRAISQGRVSKQTVNQAVKNAETMIAAGQFTYEQKRLCQFYTMVTRQFIQQSKDRF